MCQNQSTSSQEDITQLEKSPKLQRNDWTCRYSSFPLTVFPRRTGCKTPPHASSSMAGIPTTKFTLEELAHQESAFIQTYSSLPCATLLLFLLCEPAAHHEGQQLRETTWIRKWPPGCYLRAEWFASDGSHRQRSPPTESDLANAVRLAWGLNVT